MMVSPAAKQMGIPRGILAVFWIAVGTALCFCCLFNGSYFVGDLLDGERSLRTEPEILPPKLSNDPAHQTSAIPAPDYHIVVSTACSTYQDWQSYVMFYHTFRSGQVSDSVGYVTRVVSGCSEEEAEKMNRHHQKEIAPIAPGKFFIHHTPDFKFTKPGLDYKFFNKPLGYRHWMQNVLRYPYEHDKYDNVTYILMDPDQIMLRPFQNNFTNEVWARGDRRIVERGQAFAQEYAMGVQFFNGLDMKKIAPLNELPSPVKKLTKQDRLDYMVGPPYIMKGFDLWRVINKWAEFAPWVYEQTTDHLSEMYAYSIAAAHLGLKHQVAHTFMVSNADIMHGEGWVPVQDKRDDQVCGNVPKEDLPHVLHYCQEYGLGKFFFSKYRLKGDFISCESPLLSDPPTNISSLYNYMIHPGNNKRRVFSTKKLVKRAAFMLCYMIQSMNSAAVYYKQHNCGGVENANFNRTLSFFDNMTTDVTTQ